MRPRTDLLLCCIIALSATAAAQTADEAEAPVTTAATPTLRDPASPGLDLYRQQYCGLCHTLDRAGTAGIFGPTHNQLVTIAERRIREEGYKGKATTAEAYIRESITEPDVYLVPGFEASVHRMPAYKHLTPEAIDAIVEFLLKEE